MCRRVRACAYVHMHERGCAWVRVRMFACAGVFARVRVHTCVVMRGCVCACVVGPTCARVDACLRARARMRRVHVHAGSRVGARRDLVISIGSTSPDDVINVY